MESPSFSADAFPLAGLELVDEDSAADDFSAMFFCSASFLALAFAFAEVDKTAVGSFTADVAAGTVVGLGYSNNEGFAWDRKSNFGTFRSLFSPINAVGENDKLIK